MSRPGAPPRLVSGSPHHKKDPPAPFRGVVCLSVTLVMVSVVGSCSREQIRTKWLLIVGNA
jgi:hypothetical protein